MSFSGSGVRLRYTGMVLFFSKLFSVLTGLVFVLLITRKLPVEQYGLWRMINNYIIYTFVFVDVYNYWLPRNMARGINASKTGLTLSLILGSAATMVYLAIALWFSKSFDQPLQILLIAAPQVVLYYFQYAIESVSSGYAPQFNGYSRIVFELVKVGLAFLLVFYFRIELSGAILAVMFAQIVSIVFLVMLNFRVIADSSFDLSLAKIWLKHSWLPIFGTGISVISGLDVLVVRLFSGNEYPAAYLGIAITMSGLVTNASIVASALYPRLLAKASISEIKVVMKLMYMFAIPISIFMFFYAEPISALYGLKYLVAIDTAKAAIIGSLIFVFPPLLDVILLGLEHKDAISPTSKDILNSMLFKLPLLNCVISFIHLATVYVLQIGVQSDVEASLRWIMAIIASNILTITVKLIILRRSFKISVSTSTMMSLFRYLAISLLATFASFNIWKVAPSEKILELISSLVPPAAFTATFYFVLLAIVDRDFKELLKDIAKNVVSTFKNK